MSDVAQVGEPKRRTGTVQSVERAFRVLEAIADAGGEASISELSELSDLPVPTIHRLLQTLLPLGYVHQLPNRWYGLGARLVRLGERAAAELGGRARPELIELVRDLGETSNLAMLDGDRVVYVAQSPSPHAMRMFTEVGRRALLHNSGVGKAIAADLPWDRVETIVSGAGMTAATPRTLTTLPELQAELATVRERGYAVDDEEQERGVRCYAVRVPGGPVPLAVSVIGPTGRVDDRFSERAVPRLHQAAAMIGQLLN